MSSCFTRIQKFLPFLHALEVNGMRSRRENREVVVLAEEVNLPVVAGGDRHGFEPNAVLNLSCAGSFEEFIWECHNFQSPCSCVS